MSEFFEKIRFRKYDFFVLRDDLIGGEFNGNKARKLEYFLNADLSAYASLASTGSAQSNAMSALSVLAKIKGLDFYYIPTHISDFLKQNPCGNYKNALKNGMKIVDKKPENSLFIPQGVACKQAEHGFLTQAKLIKSFMDENNIVFDIFLPSGTGTSAYFLAKNLPQCDVFTIPCVGDVSYLKQQILELTGDFEASLRLKILKPSIKCYFGDLKKEFFDIWQELENSSKIRFELIYDPLGWLTLLENINIFKKPILYIHQGGLSGVESQLARYERNFGKVS